MVNPIRFILSNYQKVLPGHRNPDRRRESKGRVELRNLKPVSLRDQASSDANRLPKSSTVEQRSNFKEVIKELERRSNSNISLAKNIKPKDAAIQPRMYRNYEEAYSDILLQIPTFYDVNWADFITNRIQSMKERLEAPDQDSRILEEEKSELNALLWSVEHELQPIYQEGMCQKEREIKACDALKILTEIENSDARYSRATVQGAIDALKKEETWLGSLDREPPHQGLSLEIQKESCNNTSEKEDEDTLPRYNKKVVGDAKTLIKNALERLNMHLANCEAHPAS
jgi:hypothetical protein